MKIVCLGDSITLGVRPGVTEDQTFESILARMFADTEASLEIVNAGIGSEMTSGGLARFTADVIDTHPDYLMIMYGTNDAAIDEGSSTPRLHLSEYEHNLCVMVDVARETGIIPILMTSIPLGDNWFYTARSPYKEHGANFAILPYIEAVRKIAAQKDVLLIDHNAAWREWEKRTGLNIESLQTDSCHPNPEGHKLIAKTIYNMLAPVLAGRVLKG